MEIVGYIILVLGGGYLLYSIIKDKFTKKDKQKKTKAKNKKREIETVQDLLNFESISNRGIVKLKNGTYTATIEVTQINQRLNNVSENAAIWKNFRTLMNSIGVRQTLLVQSQYLDISDFVNEYNEAAESITNLTPQLLAAKMDVIDDYKEFAEQKTREYRSYVIFRFNPRKDQQNKGVESGNALLDSILSSVRGQVENMSDEEAQELAENILEEVSDLAFQMFNTIGIQSVRLNKEGVLAQLYATLNRDLTMVQRLRDASEAHSFTEFKQSLTAYDFEQKLNDELKFSINSETDIYQDEVAASVEEEMELVTQR